MNDEQLKVIYDIQDLLGISYQEAYKIVDEYIYYGDVDLSDFDEIDDISQLIPKEKEIMLDILSNQETISSLNTYEKEVLLNIMNNQENISYLKPRDKEVLLNIIENKQESVSHLKAKDKEVLLNIMNNVQTVPLVHTYDKEILLHLMNNQEHISKLTTKDKEVVLSLLNNTKIDLLTTKSSVIDLDVSKSDNDSVQLLDINDKELFIDIEFGEPTTPSDIDLDNINPLSISSISSIYQNDINVNTLDKLTLSDISLIKEIEQDELKQLSMRKLPSVHEFNMNEIDSLSINNLSNISNIGDYRIGKLNINRLPSISMKHKLYKYVPYLTIGSLPSITPFDIQSIDTLQLSKLDNFKWGRINARVKRKELPLLSLNSISDINNVELSELEELVLYDLPELPNFDIQPIKAIEYDTLHLDDNLDILNEIIKSDILPPITKEYIISKGGDADTVNDLYDTYRENSSSYSKSSIDVFFQYALAAADEAIANGGKEKGLYKIVTEERGTFLPFITELYMTELCQYDYNPGLVIQEYLKVIKSFLVVEAEKYNLEVI